jgi:hypothetical protein
MRAPRKALLLIGSPKAGRSSSRSLGEFVVEQLEERGVSTETLSLIQALRSEEATQALLAAVDRADLVVLVFPLYVDTLPAAATRALERVARHRAARAQSVARVPGLVALCQSGFPEPSQNAVALEICRSFARAARFEWAGGLALGGGAAIDGRPLRELGALMSSCVRALESAVAAVAEGLPVPDEAVRRMAWTPLPRFAYRAVGNLLWLMRARKVGGRTPLDARPFAAAPSPGLAQLEPCLAAARG